MKINKNGSEDIAIKKILQMTLGKCDIGKDSYDLNIINVPKEDGEDKYY